MTTGQALMIAIAILLAPHLSARDAKIAGAMLWFLAALESQLMLAFVKGLLG